MDDISKNSGFLPLGWSLERDGAPDAPEDRTGPCGTCAWALPCAMLDGSARLVCACDPTSLAEVDPREACECWEDGR